jgi:hypothetical protein
MSVVPGDIPVTTPAEETVPTAAVPLIHAPPVEVVLKVVVAPGQTDKMPVIGTGVGLTVMFLYAKQPVGRM